MPEIVAGATAAMGGCAPPSAQGRRQRQRMRSRARRENAKLIVAPSEIAGRDDTRRGKLPARDRATDRFDSSLNDQNDARLTELAGRASRITIDALARPQRLR